MQKRKPNRLKNFDYSQNGAYFITICTKDKKHILSTVGAIHELPETILSEYGMIVNNIIKEIPKRFNVTISNYVIMPNHIHLLIEINHLNERTIRELSLRKNHSVISNIIGYLKMNSSKEIHKINPDEMVWQRSYYDHIIRNETDYLNIWEYINNNPLNWCDDKYYKGDD